MNSIRLLLLVIAGGCAAPEPIAVIDARHPASPHALEYSSPAKPALRMDASTRRTRELIAAREKESQTGTPPPKDAAPTKAPGPHDHH